MPFTIWQQCGSVLNNVAKPLNLARSMQNCTTSGSLCRRILQEIMKGQGPYRQGRCLCFPVSHPAGLLRGKVPYLQPTMPTLTSITWTHLPRYPTPSPLPPLYMPCSPSPPSPKPVAPICPSADPVHIYTLLLKPKTIHKLSQIIYPRTHTTIHTQLPLLLFCALYLLSFE